MAIARVGALGAASQGVSGAAVTPAYGQAPTAGSLLVCWAAANASASNTMAVPTGWGNAGGFSWAAGAVAIYYKLATGGDAAPTIAGITGSTIAAMLGEFSGASGFVDRRTVAPTLGTTSPYVFSANSPDGQVGNLVCYTLAATYSAAAVKTFTDTLNNGQTATVVDNAATSTVNHYHFLYGIQTSNAATDQDSLVWTTTNIAVTGCGGWVASFYPAGFAPRVYGRRVMSQAVQRAAARCWAQRPSGISVPRLWTPADDLAVI